jgi:hypothetical protein
MASAPALKCELDPTTGEIIEDEALRAEGLAQLRRAIAAAQAKDKSFVLVREDAQFLLPFLRARKYEVPRALVCLKSFCAYWYGSPGVVEGLCGERVRATCAFNAHDVAPARCARSCDPIDPNNERRP